MRQPLDTTSIQIDSQVIADDSDTSATLHLDIDKHERGMPVTEFEFKRKWKKLLEVVNAGYLPPTFSSVETKSGNQSRTSQVILLYTKDGAGLTISLNQYGSSHGGKAKFYLGMRGSPTKLLSGQNLRELNGNELVEELQEKHGLSEFMSTSISPFILFHRCVKKMDGEGFFSDEEARSILSGNLTVRSIGFATYEDFSKDRDLLMKTIRAAYCTQTFEGEGELRTLGSFFGVEKASFFEKMDSEGNKQLESVTITKSTRRDKTHKDEYFSQAIYLKPQEIEAKKETSGKKNMSEFKKLNSEDQDMLKTSHVRIDNVFYKEELLGWVKLLAGKDRVDDGNVWLTDLDYLFHSKENIRNMIRQARTGLGMRTILMAPDRSWIGKFVDVPYHQATESEIRLVKEWLTSTEDTFKVGDGDRYRTANGLYDKYYLDLNLPPRFYTNLSYIRAMYWATEEETEILKHRTLGIKGLGTSPEKADEIALRLAKRSNKTLNFIRSQANLVLPYRRKAALFKSGLLRLGEK
jgi:hypothetical protein